MTVVLLLAGLSDITGASRAQSGEVGCTPAQKLAGLCPTVNANIRDGEAVLDGSANTAGSSGAGRGGPARPGAVCRRAAGCAGAPAPVPPPLRDGYTVTAPVTLRDLVGFRPASGIDYMQPNGWMVVGLDTNFYAVAGVQEQRGLLLAQEASVRFTAIRYHWSYGDGATRSTTTGGSPWAAQGAGEFDATLTSHIYRSPGTYSIDLTIEFSAEYRYAGGDWTAIAGSIPVQANRLVATAGEAQTVLVGSDCAANPSGPGC
ncbi:PKD domain-containing protein [Lacisediminihabitans profunda]|uniref:PKD domain-containing protein n=1 Tax=Lacisediminihabitans profunda TaxID=2594790 RepID=A0A5C8UUF9_9MICO|nr:PKD domain-containing protein [Lacisediminihabitans profunda]TXN31276.1 hypothetical protein FVP33_06825 [Lacisediminihabitans profunda]